MRKNRRYRVLDNALKPVKVFVLSAIAFGVSACATVPVQKTADLVDPHAPKKLKAMSQELIAGHDIMVVNATPLKERVEKIKADGASEEKSSEDLAGQAKNFVLRAVAHQASLPLNDERIKKLDEAKINYLAGNFDFSLGVSVEKKQGIIFVIEHVPELYWRHNIPGLDEALGPAFFKEYPEIVRAHESFHAWQEIEQKEFYKQKKQKISGRVKIEEDADSWAHAKAYLAGVRKKSILASVNMRAWDLVEGYYCVDHGTSPRLNELIPSLFPEEEARGKDPATKMSPEKIADVALRFHIILDVEMKGRYREAQEGEAQELLPWEEKCIEAGFPEETMERLRRLDTMAYCLQNNIFDEEQAVLGAHLLKGSEELFDIVIKHAEGLPEGQKIFFEGYKPYENAFKKQEKGDPRKVVEAFKAVKDNLKNCAERKNFFRRTMEKGSICAEIFMQKTMRLIP